MPCDSPPNLESARRVASLFESSILRMMIAIPRRRIFDCRADLKSFATVAGPDQPTWVLIDGKIHTGVKARAIRKLTVWVDARIDEFRLYPDSAPCEVRFSSVESVEPAS
jgi:hypothetical protein